MERMKNQINLQMLSLLEIVEGGARTYIITGVQNGSFIFSFFRVEKSS